MSVKTYYFTDNKTWVDCVLERDYCYNKKSFPASINIVDLSCRARAHKHPDDIFDEYFGKELSLAYAERDSANKKVKFLLKLSRKFSKEQNYSRKILEPIRKQFKSRLTKLNELELEEIYQALQEMHKKARTSW